MSNKKMVSFRFSQDVVDMLKARAAKDGISVTELMKRIIIRELFK